VASGNLRASVRQQSGLRSNVEGFTKSERFRSRRSPESAIELRFPESTALEKVRAGYNNLRAMNACPLPDPARGKRILEAAQTRTK
jgi:hypothetical protein